MKHRHAAFDVTSWLVSANRRWPGETKSRLFEFSGPYTVYLHQLLDALGKVLARETAKGTMYPCKIGTFFLDHVSSNNTWIVQRYLVDC